MNKVWYEFQVFDEEDDKWFRVGGEVNSIEFAEMNAGSYEYSRDKRTRKPQTRIVEFSVVSRVVSKPEITEAKK